jgi:L-rhamnose-H+ transport protein
MAYIILVANAWGLVLKEWKGVSKKALTTVIVGIIVIIVSVLVVGMGNNIKAKETAPAKTSMNINKNIQITNSLNH